MGHTPDDGIGKSIGSSGFGSLIGGLQFRVSRFSAFGQYQVTSAPSVQVLSAAGPEKSTIVSSGNFFKGTTHTLDRRSQRFGLGNARERPSGGGY